MAGELKDLPSDKDDGLSFTHLLSSLLTTTLLCAEDPFLAEAWLDIHVEITVTIIQSPFQRQEQ